MMIFYTFDENDMMVIQLPRNEMIQNQTKNIRSMARIQDRKYT